MPTHSITISAAHQTRASAALGKDQHLVDGNGDPRNATGAELKTYMINTIVGMTKAVEKRVATEVAVDLITEITPT